MIQFSKEKQVLPVCIEFSRILINSLGQIYGKRTRFRKAAIQKNTKCAMHVWNAEVYFALKINFVVFAVYWSARHDHRI